ncbi:phage tail protein [Salinicola corii]|uniref:Phage tail protein n=1 Tax=Salinicola corii TaxID=2606937 RepID=A0A640WJG5_9GAMM|nr:portal protein [Salinicola corii]KAA0020730.1 phage tail protein [Salinicola corii]
MADESELRKKILARHSELKNERTSWETVWKELSSYFQPLKAKFLCDDNASKRESRENKLVDNTGVLASRTLASGMMAGITSPARPWFKFELPDEDLNDDQEVQVWLEDTTKRCLAAMSRSNVYSVLNKAYLDLGVFCTHCFLLLEDDVDDIRAVAMPIGSYCLDIDYRGRVNTMYREYRMTVHQVVDEFGKDAVSDRVRRNYEKGGAELQQKVDIIHAIEPNPDHDPDSRDAKKLPFRSIYIEKGSNEGDGLLRHSGFHENPIIAPRWMTQAGETYGTGPGWDGRGDCKALQLMQSDKHKAVAKLINPPLNVPSGMQNAGRVSLNPGAVNYYDEMTGASGGKGIHPVYQMTFDIGAVLQDIQDTRQRINEAFYVDLFRLLMNDDRSGITAREVQERHEEKMLLLGPVLESVQKDLQEPLLDRVFGILWRRGKLMPPPEIMAEMEDNQIRVEYTSVLAQAQRLVGIQSTERFLSFAGNMAGAFPSVLDNINQDKAIRDYGESVGVSPTIFNSEEDVAAARQAKQQQQQAQQMAEAAQQGIQGAKLLSETDTGDGTNALQTLTQGGYL